MGLDPNQMAELAALKRYRYARDGGGGASVVYETSKAYWDARGYKEMSEWEQLRIATRERFRMTCQIQREQFRLACLTSKEGFYHGDSIPF